MRPLLVSFRRKRHCRPIARPMRSAPLMGTSRAGVNNSVLISNGHLTTKADKHRLVHGDSKLLTKRSPPPKYPVVFLCLLSGHKLGALLRREGG